jgi:hypothetical protein
MASLWMLSVRCSGMDDLKGHARTAACPLALGVPFME